MRPLALSFIVAATLIACRPPAPTAPTPLDGQSGFGPAAVSGQPFADLGFEGLTSTPPDPTEGCLTRQPEPSGSVQMVHIVQQVGAGIACVYDGGLTPGTTFTLTLTSTEGVSARRTVTIGTAFASTDPTILTGDQPFAVRHVFEEDTLAIQLPSSVAMRPESQWLAAVDMPDGRSSVPITIGPQPQVFVTDDPDPFVAMQAPSLTAGEAITLAGSGFLPEEGIIAGVYDRPLPRGDRLAGGAATTDASGQFRLPFTADLPQGRYYVTLWREAAPANPLFTALLTPAAGSFIVGPNPFDPPPDSPPVAVDFSTLMTDDIPLEVEVTGDIALELAVARCFGFSQAAPTVQFEVSNARPAEKLAIDVAAQDQPLVVRYPNGTMTCTVSGVTRLDNMNGTYRLWLGTLEQGGALNTTITIRPDARG